MKSNSKYTTAASKVGRIPYTSFHPANCRSLLTSYTEYNDHSRDDVDSVFMRPAFAGDEYCIPNTIESFRSGSRKSSNDHRIRNTMIFSEDGSGSMAASMMGRRRSRVFDGIQYTRSMCISTILTQMASFGIIVYSIRKHPGFWCLRNSLNFNGLRKQQKTSLFLGLS